VTPDQFNARYAPTAKALGKVRAWLTRSGFQISSDTPDNNRWVETSDDVSKIEHQFSTQIRTYRHAGRVLRAPSSDVRIPRTVAGSVAGIAGLDGSNTLIHPQQSTAAPSPGDIPGAPPAPAFQNAPPCSSYWGQKPATGTPPAYGKVQPYAPCGYVPAPLQGAYGVNTAIANGNDGAGQTVAIIDAFASPTIQQDANRHANRHGQGPVNLRQIVPPGIYDCQRTSPRAATRRAGTARRRWTSSRSTPWPRGRTCSTWAARTATTSR